MYFDILAVTNQLIEHQTITQLINRPDSYREINL